MVHIRTVSSGYIPGVILTLAMLPEEVRSVFIGVILPVLVIAITHGLVIVLV